MTRRCECGNPIGDLDPHSMCTKCRGTGCAQDNTCPECQDLSPKQWKALSEWKGKSVPPRRKRVTATVTSVATTSTVTTVTTVPPPPTKVSLMSSDSIFSSDIPDMTHLDKDVQKMSSLEKRLSEQEMSMVKQSSAMSELSESVKQLLFSLAIPKPSEESVVSKTKVPAQGTSSTVFMPYEDPILPPLSEAPRSNPYAEDYSYQRETNVSPPVSQKRFSCPDFRGNDNTVTVQSHMPKHQPPFEPPVVLSIPDYPTDNMAQGTHTTSNQRGSLLVDLNNLDPSQTVTLRNFLSQAPQTAGDEFEDGNDPGPELETFSSLENEIPFSQLVGHIKQMCPEANKEVPLSTNQTQSLGLAAFGRSLSVNHDSGLPLAPPIKELVDQQTEILSGQAALGKARRRYYPLRKYPNLPSVSLARFSPSDYRELYQNQSMPTDWERLMKSSDTKQAQSVSFSMGDFQEFRRRIAQDMAVLSQSDWLIAGVSTLVGQYVDDGLSSQDTLLTYRYLLSMAKCIQELEKSNTALYSSLLWRDRDAWLARCHDTLLVSTKEELRRDPGLQKTLFSNESVSESADKLKGDVSVASHTKFMESLSKQNTTYRGRGHAPKRGAIQPLLTTPAKVWRNSNPSFRGYRPFRGNRGQGLRGRGTGRGRGAQK